jgi:GcrA cell cycle regulator
MANFNWTEQAILQLRDLWDEGHSTAEIGRRLGISRNAVVGKSHRLDLTARPSPIKGVSDPVERQKRLEAASAPKARRSTLPILPSVVEQIVQSIVADPPAKPPVVAPVRFSISAPPVVVPPPPRVAALPPTDVDEPAPSQIAEAMPVYARRASTTCCWPVGEPGRKDFRFCDDAAVPGKPYCEEHCRIGYVKIRVRPVDAEATEARLAG